MGQQNGNAKDIPNPSIVLAKIRSERCFSTDSINNRSWIVVIDTLIILYNPRQIENCWRLATLDADWRTIRTNRYRNSLQQSGSSKISKFKRLAEYKFMDIFLTVHLEGTSIHFDIVWFCYSHWRNDSTLQFIVSWVENWNGVGRTTVNTGIILWYKTVAWGKTLAVAVKRQFLLIGGNATAIEWK